MIDDKINLFLEYNNLDGILITNYDEFFLEDCQENKNRLNIITNGFLCSNGIYLFLKNQKHKFYTDSRYQIAAEDFFQNNVDIFPLTALSLKENIPNNIKIGFLDSILRYNMYLKLKSEGKNLIPISTAQFDHCLDLKNIENYNYYNYTLSGKNINNKINEIFTSQNEDFDAIFISDITSSSWLLNRRCDNKNNGCSEQFLLIFKNKKFKIIRNINDLNDIKNQKIQLDYNTIPYIFHFKLLENNNIIINILNPILQKQAIKNKIEINGMKKAHLKDAVAINNFEKWLLSKKDYTKISELEIIEKLFLFKKQERDFLGNSFKTIAGIDSNGAIIHYHSSSKTNKFLKNNSILLLDSGSNYKYGTTDITRMYFFGEIDENIKKNYTFVLKAHIALANYKFEEGTVGKDLDSVCRNKIIEQNLDYEHATGHGVGHYLSVHEYPSISKNSNNIIQKNMIISIEPGLYFQNQYGIRIENLYLIKKNKRNLLYFYPLTKVIIDERAILFNLLTTEEKSWLLKYNKSCKKIVNSNTSKES